MLHVILLATMSDVSDDNVLQHLITQLYFLFT